VGGVPGRFRTRRRLRNRCHRWAGHDERRIVVGGGCCGLGGSGGVRLAVVAASAASCLRAADCRKTTDEMQRGRSRQLWAYPIIIVCLAPQIIMATQYALDRGGPRPLGLPRGVATISYFLVLAICLLTTVIATGMMLMGAGYPKTIRPVMDDELSRAYRAKAIASGFLASLVGGIAAFGAGLIEPRWAVLGLPFVITGSLAVAAVHFALLERRADLSG
jgi:hypothetical protein